MFTPTSIVGGCGPLPAPANVPAVGFEGASAYEFSDVVSLWTGFITWTGVEWRCVVNIGPFDPWASTNFPLTYDPVTRTWKGSAATNCGTGYSCTLSYDFEFIPELWCTEQLVRGAIDEITPDGLAVWHWRPTEAVLPGSRRRTVTNGGRLWLPDHVRGLTRKFRSVTLPPAVPARIWWEY